MSEITISVTKAMTDPQYAKTAAGLLAACRTFYQEPENEEAYRKWKEEKMNVAVDRDRVRCG